MSRGRALFTKADLARALQAAEQTAPGRFRARITRMGEIVLEPVEGDLPPLSPSEPEPVAVAPGLSSAP